MKCSKCGAETEFCPHCGARLPAPVAQPPPPPTLESRLRLRLERKEAVAPPLGPPPAPPVTPPTPPTLEAAGAPPTLACYLHPAIAAVTVCDLCGKPLCNVCLRSYRGLDLCQEDYRQVLASQAPALAAPRPGFSDAAAAASATIMLLSIIAARLYPWVASLIPTTGSSLILGVSSAAGMLGGLALKYARREIGGALVIFLFSLISLGVGGGFFVGAVLGIVAGLTMLLGA